MQFKKNLYLDIIESIAVIYRKKYAPEEMSEQMRKMISRSADLIEILRKARPKFIAKLFIKSIREKVEMAMALEFTLKEIENLKIKEDLNSSIKDIKDSEPDPEVVPEVGKSYFFIKEMDMEEGGGHIAVEEDTWVDSAEQKASLASHPVFETVGQASTYYIKKAMKAGYVDPNKVAVHTIR